MPAKRVRGLLDQARANARDGLKAGESGRSLCHGFSDALDTLVTTAWLRAHSQPGECAQGIALMATGGWGRRETCPHSDLDLLFLTRASAIASEPIVDAVLYPLWDAGLEVGHAARSLAECLALARSDLATATSLLDARFIVGDAHLAGELDQELIRAAVHRGDPNAFVRRLGDHLRQRHERFGDSVYLLEPNLKQGHGGLRDLATALWAARARWPVRDFADLVSLGQASSRQVMALVDAREFLLRLRCAVHLEAGRRQDQLTFELQERIAPRFFPEAHAAGESRSQVAPAVEELMRCTYLHARAVVRETERLLDRALVSPPRPPTVRPIDRSFLVWNGQVATRDPSVLRERPGELVRIFRVALDEKLPLYGHTRDLLAELIASDGARVDADPAARRWFLDLLCDPSDARVPSILEDMHQLGLLVALMPELGPTTGRVQHDLYHVFTVDQHQLYAVALLKRIARGELVKEMPDASEAYRRVREPRPLFLATLLHDVGKPLGRSHATKGALLAGAVARRLGLSQGEVTKTELLVKHHLAMAHLSQRRDLTDGAMIARFAGLMGDEETTTQLFLLTVCDTAMTAPGNLTEWKATLLAELYRRARAYIKRGPDLTESERQDRIRRRRQRVGELVGASAAASDWLAGVPERYLAQVSPAVIACHFRLSRGRGERPAAFEVTTRSRRGTTELLLVAPDGPGLLARITGVLVANRIDVASALINSRVPIVPGEIGEALDVFLVRDRYGRPIPAADPRWARVADDLGRVLSLREPVEDLVFARREKTGLKQPLTPTVPTEIEVDNEVAAEFTVVDVFTQDRLGVLFAITTTLDQLGLDISLSKVATEAARVADVFYVRDRVTRSKITEPDRLAQIVAQLHQALRPCSESAPCRADSAV